MFDQHQTQHGSGNAKQQHRKLVFAESYRPSNHSYYSFKNVLSFTISQILLVTSSKQQRKKKTERQAAVHWSCSISQFGSDEVFFFFPILRSLSEYCRVKHCAIKETHSRRDWWRVGIRVSRQCIYILHVSRLTKVMDRRTKSFCHTESSTAVSPRPSPPSPCSPKKKKKTPAIIKKRNKIIKSIGDLKVSMG